MCGATVRLPSPVLQVMFPYSDVTSARDDLDPSPNDVCVFLGSGQLGFIQKMESTPQLHRVVPVVWECPEILLPSPSCLSHWLWLSHDHLICVVCIGGNTHLCRIKVDDQAANVISTTPLEEAVLTVSHGAAATQALIQLSSGALLRYQDGELNPLPSLPELCVSVRAAGPNMFARAHNCHLYVDGELVANNVTSFFCLPGFLVMTLNTHQLSITRADTGFKVQDSEGSTSRRLERGSSLVVVVGHSVVLQLPRGNLETVEPRALTLVMAARLLDAGDYKSVAQLLRRQRIDLNLCVDHNHAAFLVATHRFVTQIRDPQWLSVFLAELSEQDVTRGMYAGYYAHLSNRSPPLADKVNRVCTALRAAMSQTPEDQEFFLQPILSTYVRSGRVGEAIALADSEQALNHLTLLMSTDKLYEEALATYNLEKALKIAGKSLKDPKEYVVYLNELRAMEPAYMRFTIDRRQRKPQSALSNLAQCSDRREECLQYIKDTALYTLALDLFKDQSDTYGEVCLQYGAYLLDKHQYYEAGLMFSRGGDVERAVAALTKAGCWRQSLSLASQHNYSQSALSELHQALYSALHGSQLFSEAAQLCCHLGWQDKAISCFTEAHSWSQAVFLCHSSHQTNLIDSVVRPALLECQSRTQSDLRAKTELLDKHCARLLVVREKKANIDSNYDAMSDIQSDTSSISSFSTSSAGTRTTKNTRKAQRKLWSLKEGNPREEQALLYTITELVHNTERLTGEVHVSCLALAELDMDSEARTLHAAMSAALERVEQIKRTTWPSSTIKKTGSDAEAVDPSSIDTQLNYPPSTNISQSWRLNIYT